MESRRRIVERTAAFATIAASNFAEATAQTAAKKNLNSWEAPELEDQHTRPKTVTMLSFRQCTRQTFHESDGFTNIQQGFFAMYLVVIAWLYVAVMMAVAEAMHSNGSVLGAIVTFFFYGLGPISLVVYLMRTPARRKARKQLEAQEAANPLEPAPEAAALQEAGSNAPNTSGHAATAAQKPGVPPVREIP
jgi:hypothetical protein